MEPSTLTATAPQAGSLLEQGLQLLVYGMGTVVVFLVLLVFALRLMSWAILRFFPESPEPETARRRPDSAPSLPSTRHESVDPVLLAAVVAAVHQHRLSTGAARPHTG
jgi:oxaloacetate decarboxylase gamma subunit